MPPIIQASLTYNNFGRLLVFKLGGKESLPIPNVRDKTIPSKNLYRLVLINCKMEKANIIKTVLFAMDLLSSLQVVQLTLRKMTAGTHDAFNQIVLEGLLASNGMASFSDVLLNKKLKTYIIMESQSARG